MLFTPWLEAVRRSLVLDRYRRRSRKRPSRFRNMSNPIEVLEDRIVLTQVDFSISGDTVVTEDTTDGDDNEVTYTISYSGTLDAGETTTVDVSHVLNQTAAADYVTDVSAALTTAAAGVADVTFDGTTLTFEGPQTISTSDSGYAGTASIGSTQDESWSNISNATGSADGNKATIDVGRHDLSDELLLTNFGLNIPTGATIEGITVTLNTTGSASNPDNAYYATRITKNGSTSAGTAPAPSGTWTSGSVVRGSSTNLWGTTWTASELNASSFGLIIQIEDGEVSIDSAEIEVAYSVNNAGSETKNLDFTIEIDDDTATEGNEAFSVTLSNASRSGPGAASPYTLMYDGHGSTRALLDATAAFAQHYAYTAYGKAIGFDEAQALTALLYSGEAFDSRVGLQYLRARWYDPNIGRFNRLDPFSVNLSDPQSLHKYLYAHGDPVNGIDPTGKFVLGLVGALNSSAGALTRTSAEATKTEIARTASIALTATGAGGIIGMSIHEAVGESPVRGFTYGSKLGFGAYAAYRTGNLNKVLAEGAKQGLIKAITPTWSGIRDLFELGNSTTIGGSIIVPDFLVLKTNKPFGFGKIVKDVAIAAFEGFSEAVYNESISLLPAPSNLNNPFLNAAFELLTDSEFVDALDAVITSIVADLTSSPRPQKGVILGNAATAGGTVMAAKIGDALAGTENTEFGKKVAGVSIAIITTVVSEALELWDGKYSG